MLCLQKRSPHLCGICLDSDDIEVIRMLRGVREVREITAKFVSMDRFLYKLAAVLLLVYTF